MKLERPFQPSFHCLISSLRTLLINSGPPSYRQLYWHANADWQKLRCGDLLDIGAVGVSKPVFALNNAGHCGELSLAPTSILEHD